MERKTLSVCVALTVLGIIAVALGFAAEATRAKNPTLKVLPRGLEPIPYTDCEYPSSPAMGLAIAAVVALVLVRVIIVINTGGCFSGCRVPNLPRITRVSMYMLWITSLVAKILFIIGAKLSDKQGVVTESLGYYHCYVMPSGIFLIASIIALLSVPLAPVYYLNYVSAINEANGAPGLELEAPPVADVKKPPVTDGKKPQKQSQKN